MKLFSFTISPYRSGHADFSPIRLQATLVFLLCPQIIISWLKYIVQERLEDVLTDVNTKPPLLHSSYVAIHYYHTRKLRNNTGMTCYKQRLVAQQQYKRGSIE